MKECKDCLYQNNVVENGHQRGIIVHDTHLSTVDSNILYNIRGAGIYIEDGNEMWNKIQYNVIICPWIWTDEIMNGCTVPGTSNREGDTKLNQAGIYSLSSTNDLVGNRVVNSFNGMFFDSGASGRVNGRPICLSSAQIGRMEGNTFHSNGRFGFYIKGNNYPKITDRALDTEGMNEDLSYCNGFYDDNMYGEDRIHDRGIPVAHVDTFDYGNAFVGHYNAGDIQYHRHASINNLNLVYWKETKNFANGCASHIVDSYYANGNLALPDQSTFIIERTTFAQDVRLEANHHCNVGITGVLCMPQYILHEIQWQNANDRNWIWFQYFDTQGHGANQHHGGVFSLSPPDAQRAQEAEQGGAPLTNNIFPPGFVSLVSWKYTYLLSVPNNACVVSDSLGEVYGRCYDHGILCKVPLRALKIYSRGLNVGSAPKILLEAWFGSNSFDEQSNRQPDARQEISYNQIGHDGQTQKQGYSVPVIPGVNDHSYRISVAGWDGNVPKDWVIEFSDPVMGNRWETEYLKVNIQGRDCGGPNGVISSQHDRRFLWSGDSFMDEVAWGNHGACTDAPPMETFDCNGRMEVSSDSAGLLSATECPELCIDSPCDTRTSYCNCGTATCECKAGFSGPDCQIDVCSQTSCGVGVCTERYLGGSPRSVDISLHPCICEDGFCHQQAPNTQESIYSSGCECYSDNECVKFPGTCLDDGSCPEPSPVEDGTACDNGSDGLCLAGVCQEDPEPTIIDNFAEEVNNLIPDDTPIIFKPETPTTTFNKEETTSEPPEVPQPLPVNNVMVESMGPDNFVPIASEMEEDEAEDEQFALPLVEVTSTAAVESQSACQSYCQGEYPYGCAEHIEGKVSYRCHPRGDCYYADSFDETSPFDGFCQYKQVEMPIEPVHNVPVATSAQADPCAGYCTGKYPYGCSLSVPGKNIYQCHPNGGCFYTTHENEKIPEGFCKYLEL